MPREDGFHIEKTDCRTDSKMGDKPISFVSPYIAFGPAPTEKRCGTCRFWGGHNPEENMVRFRHQPCERIKHDKENVTSPQVMQYPDHYDDSDVDAQFLEAETFMENFEDPAVVQDGSGYLAALKTREDFGCCLWQQKE